MSSSGNLGSTYRKNEMRSGIRHAATSQSDPRGNCRVCSGIGIPQLAIPRSTLERQPLTRFSDDSISPEIIRSAEQMRHVNQG